MTNDPLFRPLIATARDLRAKQLTVGELVEAAIARHERFGEKLHAYSHWSPEQARAAAPRLHAIDVIASPTLCLTPPLMSEVTDPDGHLRANRRIVRNTVAVNYLGLCAITLSVGRDRAGMPVGLQLIAPAGAEERLLVIALAAERVLGTAADRLGTPRLLGA
jgi:Asp-tRNA(Asn)/Glu-tRNA(Gln) amidotransferase A subunit family amidase